MSKTTEHVEREVTETYSRMFEKFGMDPVLVKLYIALFFSTKPLGMQELTQKTGYSMSSVCTAMDVVEKMMDVRKFKKPGSKKVYYECEHDTHAIVEKKISQADAQIMEMIGTLKKAETKIKTDKSPEAKTILENIKKLRKDHELYHELLHNMLSVHYIFERGKQ